MDDSDAVMAYWLDEVGEAGWYDADTARDDDLRRRWEPLWQTARQGALTGWLAGPDRVLAYVILTDQFPRNMFRGDARAFATDPLARTAALRALANGWDLRVAEPQRQFMYLPFEHSEVQVDQDRAVRLMKERLPAGGAENLLHARAHREVIRRFGRFPFRNAALGRPDTPAEAAFMAAGAYAAIVRDLRN